MDNPITDADREAAAQRNVFPEIKRAILAGERDDHCMVQAFARHRALGAEQERAKVVAWLRGGALRAWGADSTGATETTFYADAIERGEHRA